MWIDPAPRWTDPVPLWTDPGLALTDPGPIASGPGPMWTDPGPAGTCRGPARTDHGPMWTGPDPMSMHCGPMWPGCSGAWVRPEGLALDRVVPPWAHVDTHVCTHVYTHAGARVRTHVHPRSVSSRPTPNICLNLPNKNKRADFQIWFSVVTSVFAKRRFLLRPRTTLGASPCSGSPDRALFFCPFFCPQNCFPPAPGSASVSRFPRLYGRGHKVERLQGYKVTRLQGQFRSFIH